MSTDSDTEKRASSPDEDSGQESVGAGGAGDLAIRTKFTNFFIDNILRPDFGRCHFGSGEAEAVEERLLDDGSGRKRRDEERKENKPGGKLRSGDAPDETGRKQWPAWVYCTRYSDRPSSGPRTRRLKPRSPTDTCPSVMPDVVPSTAAARRAEEKRPRTAFSAQQLQRLKHEFQQSNYLTEERRRSLAVELRLNESQIKIWFQNKRAKIKKANGMRNSLALQLMKQGLYNHSTVGITSVTENPVQEAATK